MLKKILKQFITRILYSRGLALVKLNKNRDSDLHTYSDLMQEIHHRCAPGVKLPIDIKKRKYVIYQCMQNLCSAKKEIVTAEFGVWRGHHSILMNEVAHQKGVKIHHHIFDSFEGLSSPEQIDGSKNSGVKFSMSPKIENIRSLLPSAYLHQGWIPDDMPKDFNDKFDLVHIDVDLYSPIKGSLDWVKTRMNKNSIIIVDDYDERWPGSVKAIDEFMLENKDNFHGIDTLNGNFLIFTL